MEQTANRNYPKPVSTNFLSVDIVTLRAAFDLIDQDVADLLASVSERAMATHSHAMSDITGLVSALSGKSSTSHTHALGDLSNVSLTGTEPDGYVLVKGPTGFLLVSPATVAGAHTHVISDVTGLTAALNGKLDPAALAAATAKGTPVDGDSLPITDSEASNGLKRLLLSSLKAFLKTYFDPIYAPFAARVPAGAMVDFAGSSAPSGWLLCYGQAVSRSTYADLFAAIGTAFGVGDGSTTFNVPDYRGRVGVGKGDMGGTGADRLGATLIGTRGSTANGVITGLASTAGLAVGMVAFGSGIGTGAVIASIDSGTQVTLSVNNSATGTAAIRFAVLDDQTLGAVGGSAVHTLTVGQMPAHTHLIDAFTNRNTASGGSDKVAEEGSGSTMPSQSTGGSQAHPNVQPAIIANKIIKT